MRGDSAVYPSFSDFKRLAKRFGRVPVVLSLAADRETPLGVFSKLARGDFAFLLESAAQDEKTARYSMVGFAPRRVFSAKGETLQVISSAASGKRRAIEKPEKFHQNPWEILRNFLARERQAPLEQFPGFLGGMVGFVAYDAVRAFERLPEKTLDRDNTPDFVFMETEELVLFDHVRQLLRLVVNQSVEGDSARSYRKALHRLFRMETDLQKESCLPLLHADACSREKTMPGLLGRKDDRRSFLEKVKKCKKYIRAGDIIQVVLSRRFETHTHAGALDIYRQLRRMNPSPYLFLLKAGNIQLIGSSPEMLIKVEGGRIETRPIAGTRPRGGTPEEDASLETDLTSDTKETAEHVMLVDLGRNDLGRVCRFGSVRVPSFKRVERYSHVMHLVSDVQGELSKGKDAIDAFQACFPAGTLTGAPKIRAMEIIEELEETRRGFYGGAVGYFGFDGDAEFAITIRSLAFWPESKGKARVVFQAGAGIVADSDPAREYEETRNKAWVLAAALERAQQEKRYGHRYR